MGQWLPTISILPSLWRGREEGGTPAEKKMGEQGRKEFPDAHSKWLVGEYLHGHGQSSHFGAKWLESISVGFLQVGIEDEELHQRWS